MIMADLNSIMEFDHVVTVAKDGAVTDGPPGVYAPSLLDGELDDSRWKMMTSGYTSQYGYSGPVMHDCESIGGQLERNILATPGVYVAVAASYTCDEHEEACECELITEGWAVAYLVGSGS